MNTNLIVSVHEAVWCAPVAKSVVKRARKFFYTYYI